MNDLELDPAIAKLNPNLKLAKQPIAPVRVYLAPADYHVLVEVGAFALSTEAPILYARPSIDVLFESAADAYGEQAYWDTPTGERRNACRVSSGRFQ